MGIKFSGIQPIPYKKVCRPNQHLCKNDHEKKDRNTDHMNFEAPLPKSTENKDLFQVLGLTGLTDS